MISLALMQALAVAMNPATVAVQVAPQVPAAQSQTPPDQAPEALPTFNLGEVTTTGRARGSVDSDIEPDLVLDESMLRTYGASNIGELLAAIEPLTQSNRGRGGGQPVLLVNGKRISGFQEIRSIPTEAIERTEILPEEVALSYGYRADQRVVNFVLKPSFRSVTTQSSVRVPTQGGRTSLGQDLDLFRITGSNRMTVSLERDSDSALYEDERDISRQSSLPYSRLGTVAGLPFGAEIDPALSALAGGTVTTALAPGSAAGGPVGLSAFVPGAGMVGEDQTAWRTLTPRREEYEISGGLARGLTEDITANFSGGLTQTSSLAYLGLPGVILTLPGGNPYSPFADDAQVYRYLEQPEALSRETDTLRGEAAAVLAGFVGDWRWTATGSFERTETDTTTGRGLNPAAFQSRLDAGDASANPFGVIDPGLLTAIPRDTANSVNMLASAEMLLNGRVFDAPAGSINSNFKFGLDRRSLDSSSTRSGVTTQRDQSRDRGSVQANFNVPIADTSRGVLAALGDLSANVNLAYEELSDFGGLSSLGGGLNWSPNDDWSFSLNYTTEDGAPTIQQLNDPVLVTPNVQIFDFTTGQTVSINRTDGGNAALLADNRQVMRFGVNWRPLSEQDLTLTSEYTRSRISDQVATFPTVTPALEQAFPDRFVRDGMGQLIAIDARPVNFDSAEQQTLRTGFNFAGLFGQPSPAAEAGPGGRSGAGGPGEGRGAGPRGGGGPIMMTTTTSSGGPRGGTTTMRMGRGRGAQMQPGQGRFNLSIYHNWRIQDEVVIRDGLPVLDLLDGASVGGRGGQPRHEITAQGGVFRNGYGMFVNANWRDSTRVDGGVGGQDLFFSDQTTVNLNLFMDLGQQTRWVERFGWLKGSRVSLGVQNLFDSRLQVRDDAGQTPLGYLPDQLDPLGRSVNLSFRKLF